MTRRTVPPDANTEALEPSPRSSSHTTRRVLLGLAVLRYVIPLIALPLIPLLVPDRIGLLTLVRPGREVLLLAGGFTQTQGSPGATITLLAFLPLMVGGVWVFFALGRAWADDLGNGSGPAWLHRMIPAEQMETGRRVLAKKGPVVAFIARVTGFPPTLVAAAAGASEVDTRAYLVADGIGAIFHFGIVFSIGLALGEAYERAGLWLTGGMLVLVIAAAMLVNRWVRAEAAKA